MGSEPAASLDFEDAAFLRNPYPVLAQLREATPIFRNQTTGQWMLTRFQEVHEALRDRRLGRMGPESRSDPLGTGHPQYPEFDRQERWSLLSLEPPDHTRIRRLLTQVFTPRAVQALEPGMRERSKLLLDDCRARPDFDLIADYAQRFSVAVICSLLGVPESASAQLLDWSHAVVKMYELRATEAQRDAAERAAHDFMAFVRDVIAHRRSAPDDGLVSALIAAHSEGEQLTEDEIVSTVIVLLNAGHEATVNTLGNGMRAFAHHPDQWRRVANGEVNPRTAVEEMIRWDPPLQLFERQVNQDGVQITGVDIGAGSVIAMLFGSANRDPRRFADPDRFDAGRGDTGHIGFGGGIHFCIGAPLARLELEVSVDELRSRFADIRLVSEPRYHPTFVIHGLEALRLASP